mmetsp:Transcript_52035/g.127004  ORF Transcript_52035/g.127004 Transcript_52035/m.127004 type:complete len:248 (+) Transcript_52035:1-744(+)
MFFLRTSLLNLPLSERREILKKNIIEVDDRVKYVTYVDTSDPEEMHAFLLSAVKDNCEGLMVKRLETAKSYYVPDKRSREWFKVKKDYMQGMTDTVDLVVLGAWYGKGKRTGVFGAYLLASFNKEQGQYESVCRLGSGFSDEILERLTAELKPMVLQNKPSTYSVPTEVSGPEVWFVSKQVWEVQAADLSLSPAHMAGMDVVQAGRGIALRFPRFLRVREDKNPSDATTSEQIVEMFRAQSNQGGGG